MNDGNNDNFNRDDSQVIVVEAQPIILDNDQPVTQQSGDAVFVMPAADDTVIAMSVSDPPQNEAVVVPMDPPVAETVVTPPPETVEQPNTQTSEPPADDNVIIPMGGAQTESQDLDKQLADMLETKQSPAEEIEEIETQVNAILSNDVISPLDEQLLTVLQQRLEVLLNDPSRTQTQPIEMPTEPPAAESTQEPPSATAQSEDAPVPQTADTQKSTAEQPKEPASQPEVVAVTPSSSEPDADTRAAEAAAAKASLLAYLALLPPVSEPVSDEREAEKPTVQIPVGRESVEDQSSELEALKARLEEVESQLRRQRRDDDRPRIDPDRRRDEERRHAESEARQRRESERRAPAYNTGAARGREYDDYYDAPARDKPSSILDNMFQQWFESEVTEKFKSLFDDKKDRRDGDEPKEIHPEMVTVSDPVSLPGLIPLGKNMYFNPSDNKAYFIAPVSSLPPGMSAPSGSIAPQKRAPAKKPARRRPTAHARPRRRRPPYSMRRRSPYGGRPLRRPPGRY